jgi:hypothetical protein
MHTRLLGQLLKFIRANDIKSNCFWQTSDKCRDDVLGTHRGGGMSCHLGLAVTEVEALVKARQERYEARASKPKQARSLELVLL